MSDGIKITIIIVTGALIALGIYIYFSPYQSCVRARTELLKDSYQDPGRVARSTCARTGS